MDIFKKDKKVVFLLDHPSRDLLPASLIGEQLNSEYIIDYQDGFYPPSGPNFFRRIKGNEALIVTPSYHVKRTRNIRSMAKFSNAKIVLLHSEQFLAPVSYREKFNLDCFEDFDKDVVLHLVWNQSFKSLLIKHGIRPEKIKVIGNPKFDSHRSLRTQKTDKSILFITNFNAADFSDLEWSKFKKEYFLDENDLSNVLYQEIRRKFIQSLTHLVSQDYVKNFDIIIRPHPGENRKAYNELLKFHNIKLSSHKDLGQDLARCGLVFLFTSSVAFEAFVMDRPVFAIEWGKLPAELMQPPSEDYNWYQSNEILDIIKNPSNYNQAITTDQFEKYFGDAHSSATRNAAKEINILLNHIEYSPKRNWFFIAFSKEGILLLLKFIIAKIITWKVTPRFLRKRYLSNYSRWKENDHYCSQEEITIAKNQSKIILKNV